MKDFDAAILSVVRARTRAERLPRRAGHAGLHRRRGGGEHPGRAPARRPAAGVARGVHRGHRRGRRLLDDRRRQAALPRRDRREGDRLAPAASPRHRRARLDAQHRQRRDGRRGGGRCHRPARVAGAAHPGDGRSCSRRSPARPVTTDVRATTSTRSIEHFGPAARMLAAVVRNTANPTMLELRLQAQRHPRRGDGMHRRAVPARATRTSSSRRCASLLPDNVSYELLVHDKALETPFDGPLVDAMGASLARGGPGRRPCCRS